MAVNIIVSAIVTALIFYFIAPSWPFLLTWVAAWVLGVAGISIGLYLIRDWWSNWSLQVALDGERTKSAIERALTEAGVAWKETTLIEVPRYFRPRFTGPIELLRPAARIWMRSWSVRPGGSEPLRHVTVVVLQLLGKAGEFDSLKSRMVEALDDEARNGPGGVDASAAGREG